MNRRFSPSSKQSSCRRCEQYSFVSSRLVKEVISLGGDIKGLVPRRSSKDYGRCSRAANRAEQPPEYGYANHDNLHRTTYCDRISSIQRLLHMKVMADAINCGAGKSMWSTSAR